MSDLQQAKELIQQGEKRKARLLLAEILRDNRNNEQAWLYLAVCVSDRSKLEQCIENVLRINPNNQEAIQLAKRANIDVSQFIAAAPTPITTQELDPITEALESIGITQGTIEPAKRMRLRRAAQERKRREVAAYMDARRRRVLRWFFIIGMVSLAILGLVVIGLYITDQQDEEYLRLLSTQDVRRNEAATIYFENTLAVSTISVQATTYAATETMIVAERILVDGVQLVAIQSNQTVEQSVFGPDDIIGAEFDVGITVPSSAQIEGRLVDADGEIIATVVRQLSSGRLLRLDPPDAGWETGAYSLEIWVNDERGASVGVLVQDE